MIVSMAPAQFRPVTLVLETQDELDQILAILSQVAENRINHTEAVRRAAITMRDTICDDMRNAE